MFGKNGFVRRVNAAVDATLAGPPVGGEQRLAATYVRGQNGNIALVSLFGPGVTQPFILAVTDQRVLLLAMGQFNASNSRLIAQLPRANVRVGDLQPSGMRASLTLVLADDGTAGGERTVGFNLVPAWKQETGEVASALGWTTPVR